MFYLARPTKAMSPVERYELEQDHELAKDKLDMEQHLVHAFNRYYWINCCGKQV